MFARLRTLSVALVSMFMVLMSFAVASPVHADTSLPSLTSPTCETLQVVNAINGWRIFVNTDNQQIGPFDSSGTLNAIGWGAGDKTYEVDSPNGNNGWNVEESNLHVTVNPCSTPTPVPTPAPLTCDSSSFTFSVSQDGHNAYPMNVVTVTAQGKLANGCWFSLNSYKTEGPTWPTSGTQVLNQHVSAEVTNENPSVVLKVSVPACYGQFDFYKGTTRYDGIDGPLPHYLDSIVPPLSVLIAWSNGGSACPIPTPSSTVTPTPSTTPSASPTPTPTATSTTSPSATPTTVPSGTTTPTATPKSTEPPTDVIDSSHTGTSNGLPLILSALALLAFAALLIPRRKFAHKRIRR